MRYTDNLVFHFIPLVAIFIPEINPRTGIFISIVIYKSKIILDEIA